MSDDGESDAPNGASSRSSELAHILEEHVSWLSSAASRGTRADLSRARLDGADLAGVDLSGALLRGVSFNAAVLRGARLTHAELCDASLREADLSGADLLLTDFTGADLSGADLSGTTSTSERELGHVRRGPRFRDAVLRDANLQRSYCAMSDFTGSQLAGADLSHANLQGADLAGNDLSGGRLSGSDLTDASLRGSNLQDADLRGSRLVNADLSGANLSRADVSGANLQGANLADARVDGIRYDRRATFRGIRVSACYGSSRFRRFAQDQDYIEEFRDAYPWAYRLWLGVTDCGRSMFRVGLWSAGFTVLFALIYLALGEAAFSVANKETLGWGLFTTLYYSLVTFTTLGFGDVTPATRLAAIVVMIEVVVGYVMLGILISILATKVARRS